MGRTLGSLNKKTLSRTQQEYEQKRQEYIDSYKQKLRELHKEKKEQHLQTIQSLREKLPFEMKSYSYGIKIIVKENEFEQLLNLLK
jgi:uncharacterized membrane-anchored protein